AQETGAEALAFFDAIAPILYHDSIDMSEIVPNYAEAILLLGRTYEATDDADEAYAQYRRASDIDPRNPEGMLRAGRLALAKRRTTLALGFLDRLLQAQPNLGEALVLYGDVLRARGDRPGAIRSYERALAEGRGNFDRAAAERALGEVRGEAPAPRPLPRATVGG
ncbi:MAG: tetratricopeptide repeat protein, partial [Myxococcota bacterium]